ncbi:carboxypeptidase regulatory-like domain-containing protein [Terriglobus sp. 2YAB30_2]|uniref:TonB-dependent receptor n=1 Tax=Terriglobus sp. 2YAB30_2 TaxID=3233023 RepID=UPI003F966678
MVTLLCLCLPCYAQFSSNVQGTVTDSSGAVIPKAAITLHNVQTGIDLRVATNATGYYRFTSVAPGNYEVAATEAGFTPGSVSVTVSPGETRGVDITLVPGSTTVSIAVRDVAETLNPEETRIVQTLTEREISQLPLPNRDVQMLLSLTPGVVGFQNETPATGYGSTIFAANFQPGYVANGEGLKSNIFLIDDLPVSDDITQGAAMILPNADMISQVSLQSQTYSVENGTGSSLQTSFSTKSGGNQFHGAVDYSYAGKNLGAAGQPTHTAGAPIKEVFPEFHQNLVLASLGGPIIKDKTFFFGSIEKQNAAIGSATTTNPHFTPSFASWAHSAFPNSGAAEGLLFAPPTRDIGGTTKTAGQYGMACGTQQTVPNSTLTYNIPCDQSVYTVGSIFDQSQPFNGIQWDVRLDQAMRGGKDRVYVMYERIDQTLGNLAERPKLDANSPSQNKYFAANHIHLFSPQLLNEVHFGNLRAVSGNFLGDPRAASIPYLPILLDSAAGFQFTFPFGITPFASQTNKEHTYALRDTVSYSFRNHTVRGGYQFYRGDYFQDSSGIYSRAFVPFYATDTFSWVSNTARAGYNLYTIGGNGKYTPQYYGATSISNGLWIDDSWKIRSNLTLTAGIRYDNFGNPRRYGASSGAFVPMFPGSGSTFQQQAWATTTHTADSAFTESQNWNFMPRAGFAYTPFKERTTLVRGGIGLYENVLTPYQIANNLPTQPPNRISLYQTGIVPYGDFATAVAPYGYSYSYPTYGTNPSGNIYSCAAMTDTANCLFSANLNGFVPTLKPEKYLNYSFGVEQQLLHNTILGVTYSGSHGYDLVYGSSAAGQGSNADYNLQPRSPAVRPTFEWGQLNYGRNGLSSTWNALIVTAKQNYRNLSFQANYNWEKALQDAPTTRDSNSTGTGAMFNIWKGIYDPRSFRGVSAFDVTNSFSFGGVYEMPKIGTSRLLNESVGGWRVGTTVIAQTGTPFSVAHEGEDYQYDGCAHFNGTTGCAGFPTYSGVQRRGFTRSQVLAGAFTTTQFKDPAGYGSQPVTQRQGVNSFRNLGYFSVNATLSKGFNFPIPKVVEGGKLFLRAEAVNLLNRTNWQAIANDVTDGNFGTVTSANQKRYLQLGGRFEF